MFVWFGSNLLFVVSKGFDLWFLNYLSDVWHEACRWSWSCFPRSNLGCFYLLTVYIILLTLGSRTNRNCLPSDGSFISAGWLCWLHCSLIVVGLHSDMWSYWRYFPLFVVRSIVNIADGKSLPGTALLFFHWCPVTSPKMNYCCCFS